MKPRHKINILEESNEEQNWKTILEKFNEFIIDNHEDVRTIVVVASTGIYGEDSNKNRGFGMYDGEPDATAQLFAGMLRAMPQLADVIAAAIAYNGDAGEGFLGKVIKFQAKWNLTKEIAGKDENSKISDYYGILEDGFGKKPKDV